MTTNVAHPLVPAQQSRGELYAKLWQAAWFIVIPMFATWLMIRYLLPSAEDSRGTLLFFIAQAALYNPFVFGVCLFLVFTALVRYWRHHLPGFRLTLPLANGGGRPLLAGDLLLVEKATALLKRLERPRSVERRHNALDANANAAIECSIRELSDALAQGNLEVVANCQQGLRAYDQPAIRAFQWVDWLRVAAIVLAPILLALGFRAQVFQSCKILGSSMLPALQDGDGVGINPSAYRNLLQAVGVQPAKIIPRRGDIIVFDNPETTPDDYLIKRVIGIPGDRISMNGGQPVINGWSVPLCDAGIYTNITGDFQPTQGHLAVEFPGQSRLFQPVFASECGCAVCVRLIKSKTMKYLSWAITGSKVRIRARGVTGAVRECLLHQFVAALTGF